MENVAGAHEGLCFLHSDSSSAGCRQGLSQVWDNGLLALLTYRGTGQRSNCRGARDAPSLLLPGLMSSLCLYLSIEASCAPGPTALYCGAGIPPGQEWSSFFLFHHALFDLPDLSLHT